MHQISENVELKVCSKCHTAFPATIEFFTVRRTEKSGLYSQCKACVKEYSQKNRQRINLKTKLYVQNNQHKVVAYRKKYNEIHKTKRLKYYQENRELILLQKKEYAQKLCLFKSVGVKRLALYDTVSQNDEGFLEVLCAYCGQKLNPTNSQVHSRLKACESLSGHGENRFYCNNSKNGNGCREACPTFNQDKYPKGFEVSSSREVSPDFRQLVLLADDYTCQKCFITISEAELHVHHIKGAVQNPLLSNDVDNAITLCKTCHKLAHQQETCLYFDYRRKACVA